ncbi:MAG TPA: cysteine synthase A [Armatimonadota bacterium]
MYNQLYENALGLIANTPLVEVHSLRPAGGARILAKHEGYNPGGSVKDRICLAMIEVAEQQGRLQPGAIIVEPTSGNTGIGLALVAALRGYHCMITMPETFSVERRRLLATYGAELVLTPGSGGMTAAIAEAERIVADTPGAFMPGQFSNPANPDMHYRTTGPEIWDQTGGKVDAFVAGVGTGGTLTGVGHYLHEKNPQVQIVALEPADSPILSGGTPGPHKIQGIGAGFVPEVLDTKVYNQVMTVTTELAISTLHQLAEEEGLLVGISAAANVWAAAQLAAQLRPDQTVVTIICDSGDKYLSVI